MQSNKPGKNMLILFLFCLLCYMVVVPAALNFTHDALDKVYSRIDEPENVLANTTPSIQKMAYLTFDDGPSCVTGEVLDILKTNGIKATFFVNYREYSKYDEMLKRIVDEGHSLGNHTYSHVYKDIYASPENFLNEIEKMRAKILEITGVDTTIFRYPGGSVAAKNFSKYGGESLDIFDTMEAAGYEYFDWNADGGDQVSPFPTGAVVAKRILATTKNLNNAVVLMHDTGNSQNTLEALPLVIQGLKDQGFTFGKLERDTIKVQFNK